IRPPTLTSASQGRPGAVDIRLAKTRRLWPLARHSAGAPLTVAGAAARPVALQPATPRRPSQASEHLPAPTAGEQPRVFWLGFGPTRLASAPPVPGPARHGSGHYPGTQRAAGRSRVGFVRPGSDSEGSNGLEAPDRLPEYPAPQPSPRDHGKSIARHG